MPELREELLAARSAVHALGCVVPNLLRPAMGLSEEGKAVARSMGFQVHQRIPNLLWCIATTFCGLAHPLTPIAANCVWGYMVIRLLATPSRLVTGSWAPTLQMRLPSWCRL